VYLKRNFVTLPPTSPYPLLEEGEGLDTDPFSSQPKADPPRAEFEEKVGMRLAAARLRGYNTRKMPHDETQN